jgi:hypothetical protein
VFERPTFWTNLARASKDEREVTQLRRFLRDYERTNKFDFGENPRRGNDPPDFIIERAGENAGVELTQLVYQDRIEAWEAMQSVKQGLLTVSRDRFSHLAGRCIYVSFGTESGMPPAGKRGRQELAAALQQFKPNPEPAILPTTTARSPAIQPGPWTTAFTELDRLPDTLPAGTVQRIGRISLMSAPLSPHEPGLLARQRGFDVALSIQTDVWESAAWSAFTERVASKDRPGSDVVIVSCGAPVIKGFSFPSDELAAEAVEVAGERHALPPTDYVSTVYLHTWGPERVARFRPDSPGFALADV